MRNKIAYVAMLFVGAGACLLIAAIPIYEIYGFWSDGAEGEMVSSDPTIKKAAKYNIKGPLYANVTYVTASGPIEVANKHIRGGDIKRLSAGGRVPIKFLKSNPHRVLYDGREISVPWAWLVVGAVLLVVALYALQLLKRESGQAK